MTKKQLVVGGLVAALAVPAGVAVAATDSPAPDEPASTQADGPGYGPRSGMTGGYGDPENCPYHDSAAMREWRQQRDERRMPDDWHQNRRERHQQMHEWMWSERDTTR